jgi:hypothetical protein
MNIMTGSLCQVSQLINLAQTLKDTSVTVGAHHGSVVMTMRDALLHTHHDIRNIPSRTLSILRSELP